jgi:uncharacterized membrane protein
LPFIRRLSLLFAVSVLVPVSALAGQPAFRTLPADDPAALSRANALSSDGTTAVGYIQARPGAPASAIRWVLSDGPALPQPLGQASPGLDTRATDVSADGSIIIGTTLSRSRTGAFRWTSEDGMDVLTPQARARLGTAGAPMVLAADGSTFGTASIGRAPSRAVRVRSDGRAEDLGALRNGPGLSAVSAASSDGSIVVGQSMTANGWRAFRRGQAGAIRPLGVLPGSNESFATACTPDGSVVVGQSGSAFRWTAQRGMESLGVLPGADESRALAVSASGQTIVGQSAERAFIWTQDYGMRDLREVLARRGTNLGGWVLFSAVGISADGRTIIGNGLDPRGIRRGWVARLGVCPADTDGSGALTAADLYEFARLWQARAPEGDFNADGTIDGRDLVDHANAYFAGCE